MKRWHPNIIAECSSVDKFIAGNTSMARNPTQTFYGHRGEIATLGFHKLKGEYYRGSIGGRENFENYKE